MKGCTHNQNIFQIEVKFYPYYTFQQLEKEKWYSLLLRVDRKFSTFTLELTKSKLSYLVYTEFEAEWSLNSYNEAHIFKGDTTPVVDTVVKSSHSFLQVKLAIWPPKEEIRSFLSCRSRNFGPSRGEIVKPCHLCRSSNDTHLQIRNTHGLWPEISHFLLSLPSL